MTWLTCVECGRKVTWLVSYGICFECQEKTQEGTDGE